MGTTPIKGMRYPDFPQVAMGPDDFNAAAYDLDANFATVDAARAQAVARPRASIRNTSLTINATKGAWTTANYDKVAYDNSGMANLGLHNDRLTIVSPGFYVVHFLWSVLISNNLGAGGQVIHGVAKNTTTLGTIPSPNFAANARQLQFDADVYGGSVWYGWQMNAADFVVGGLWWNGAPAGPFQTFVAQLTVVQLSS